MWELFVLLTWSIEHNYHVFCLGQECVEVCSCQDLQSIGFSFFTGFLYIRFILNTTRTKRE